MFGFEYQLELLLFWMLNPIKLQLDASYPVGKSLFTAVLMEDDVVPVTVNGILLFNELTTYPKPTLNDHKEREGTICFLS